MLTSDTLSSDFQFCPQPDAHSPTETMNRERQLDYIGDTHGNYEGFVFNMGKLGIIDELGNWTGGNRRLIILGDIYADRDIGSIQTALHIEKLRTQGAIINQLTGNHEDVMLRYFDHVHSPESSLIDYFYVGFYFDDGPEIDVYSGLQEFATFRKDINIPSWRNLLNGTKPVKILERMRELENGRKVLKNICSLEICKILDDTLFVHTDPVNGMVDMLEKFDWDAEKINTIFRSYLVDTLLHGQQPSSEMLQSVSEIREHFLNVDNRRTANNRSSQLSFLHANRLYTQLNVRRIIHGHTDYVYDQTIRVGNIEITSADNSSFKGGDYPPGNRLISAGCIFTDGRRMEPICIQREY